MAAVFVLLHAWQPHKELRFILPVLPLFAALAGVGLDTLLRHLPPSPARLALPLVVVAVAGVSALRMGRLTFQDLGQYDGPKALSSAWDDFGPLNRLLIQAGKLEDLCGLKVEAVHRPGPAATATCTATSPSSRTTRRGATRASTTTCSPWRAPRARGGAWPGKAPSSSCGCPGRTACRIQTGPRGCPEVRLRGPCPTASSARFATARFPPRSSTVMSSASPSRTSIPRPPRMCSSSPTSTSPR
ncbi:hypothetical protein ACN28S_51220 [Cystobacter fuscus]